MRILWLHGPPAVGKSVTAWELLNRLAADEPATAYVDIDQLGMSTCDETTDPGAHRLKAEALAAVAHEFARHGSPTLVVSGVVGLDLLPFSAQTLAGFDLSFVRLRAPLAELRRRLEGRGLYAEDWPGVEEYARELDVADLGHPVVDTAGASPAEVAASVLASLEGHHGAPAAGSTALSQPNAPDQHLDHRALLLGGTTAVGKSTIGWQAFMAAGGPDAGCAFVDLRQLGFVGRDGGSVDHGLQARNLGALWRVFRAHGAHRLIVNGPVDTRHDALRYHAALEPTPLVALRLTARPEVLLERVRARLRGEMAPLAGDLLVGRPQGDAAEIAHAAVRLQDQVGDDPGFEVMDTSDLDAGESAQQVLGRLIA
ncbi:MAG: hypothetical protein U0R80_00380 [Nocardioidaceae bacterium]